MGWFEAEGWWWSRWVLHRGLGVIYLIAFVTTARQWVPLLGAGGLLPATRPLGTTTFRRAPSIFHWRYSDGLAVGLAWFGAALSATIVLGLPQRGPWWLPMLVWLSLWLLYLSYVNIGRIFYAFGWESILLEAGFLAALLGSEHHAPPLVTLLLFGWLLFRVEFGAGLIKLRGDECWRRLTCLEYHHETQPLPGPLSWYFHRMPTWFHRAETAGNHVAQLAAPWLLFLPHPFSTVGGTAIAVTQGWLVLSGNFSWLNVLTIVLAFSAIAFPFEVPEVVASPPAFVVVVVLVALLTVVLSWWPIRNMASRRQRMNATFNPWHLVGSYGAFGSVTRERHEVIIEGRRGVGEWDEYGFPAKPGDPYRRPPQVAPYHLRLDWLLWFVPLSPQAHMSWFRALLDRLSRGDERIRRLLREDPFEGDPPDELRVRVFRYRFTTRDERRATGQWWHREPAGVLIGPAGSEQLRLS